MIAHLISSHNNYYPITFPRTLNSLLSAGVNKEHIYIFIGEFSEAIEGYRGVPYNAFDWTSLIGFIESSELTSKYSHVSLLHDTCEVGNKYKNIFDNAPLSFDVVTVAGGQCNFGLYATEFLLREKDYFLSLKTMDKQKAINEERRMFLNIGKKVTQFEPTHVETLEIVDTYGTGTLRTKEYYPGVDIYKYKANWGQTSPGSYVLKP